MNALTKFEAEPCLCVPLEWLRLVKANSLEQTRISMISRELDDMIDSACLEDAED